MLFWEAVAARRNRRREASERKLSILRSGRLPYDKRCAASTKSGRRCRGRIRGGTEFCSFHDPEVTEQQRRFHSSKGGRSRRRLSHIPDGYLRRLTDRAAVGQAMDRLYREVRMGIVTTEMGRVLFDILCRMLDSGLHETLQTQQAALRYKADRVRPKLSEMLTRTELKAWTRAAASAPSEFLRVGEKDSQAYAKEEVDSRAAAKQAALSAAS